MENVYVPENFSATEPIDFKKYFEEYQDECNLKKLGSNSVLEERLQILKDDFKFPLSLDEVKALEELCTIDKLNLINETPQLPLKIIPKDHEIPVSHPVTQEAKMLETVKCKEAFNVIKNDLHLDLKTTSLCLEDNKEDSNLVNDLQPGSTFIHKIIVHVPFNTLLGNRLTPDSVRVQYKIEVLGKNTLFEAANVIKCVSDVYVVKEVENTKVDLTSLLNAKEKYPSRCFFIENVFYNDMSHPYSVDYSTVVRKWAIENKIGEFGSESMEGVTFDALKPRLGFGYVYIHQGNCEHMITFSDTRLLQSNDCLVSSKYPRIVSFKRPVNYLCFICTTNHATWMVINSERLPVKKAFFCTKCCDSYMFFNGEKIGTFQLYPYYNGSHPAADSQERLRPDENDWGYVGEN